MQIVYVRNYGIIKEYDYEVDFEHVVLSTSESDNEKNADDERSDDTQKLH